MLKKFALNILDDVASSCEKCMNEQNISEEISQVYDIVSKNITEAVLELYKKDIIIK